MNLYFLTLLRLSLTFLPHNIPLINRFSNITTKPETDVLLAVTRMNSVLQNLTLRHMIAVCIDSGGKYCILFRSTLSKGRVFFSENQVSFYRHMSRENPEYATRQLRSGFFPYTNNTSSHTQCNKDIQSCVRHLLKYKEEQSNSNRAGLSGPVTTQ
jgi:hypothetical protein